MHLQSSNSNSLFFSTSTSLGFRIDAIKLAKDQPIIDDYIPPLKRITSSEMRSALIKFLSSTGDISYLLKRYLDRLHSFRTAFAQSDFANRHELIGTSLLFGHDRLGNIILYAIDFSKATPLPSRVKTNHMEPKWSPGSYEDGYKFGLENLINIFEQLHQSESD